MVGKFFKMYQDTEFIDTVSSKISLIKSDDAKVREIKDDDIRKADAIKNEKGTLPFSPQKNIYLLILFNTYTVFRNSAKLEYHRPHNRTIFH